MDVKRHHPDAPSKKDLLLSAWSGTDPAAGLPLPMSCPPEQGGWVLPDGGKGIRPVILAQQRAILLGHFHPRASCLVSQGCNTSQVLSLPVSAFIPFFPQVLTPRTVLKKCPAQ